MTSPPTSHPLSWLDALLFSPRAVFAVLFSASVAILGTALASQYWGGLAPCVLCIAQRYPYAIVIGLGGVGFGLARQARVAPTIFTVLAGLAALVLFVNAGIAVYHVGVEQQWWAGSAGCTGATGAATVEAMRAQILSAPIVRCDEVAWSLFGISMAGYNVVASAGLGAFTAAAAFRLMNPIVRA
ncbi:MAG: disulfide bond formation protein B [Alphaproteobacteria bacterium]